MKTLLLLLVISLLSCQEPTTCDKKPDQLTGLVLRVLEHVRIAYDTKQGEDLGRGGIKISTSVYYKQVFANCCQTQLDSVDFTRYDVLGLTTVNKGSNSSYTYDVQKDDIAKTITYTVTEEYCNRVSPSDGRGNFVVVPKLPTDYSLLYIRNQ